MSKDSAIGGARFANCLTGKLPYSCEEQKGDYYARDRRLGDATKTGPLVVPGWMRFGIGMNTDHTLEEVGQQFSVTRERIRQIEAKALRKLKHPSRSRKLRSFLDT